MSALSPIRIVGSVAVFLGHNAGAMLYRVWAPGVAACILLYVTLNLYLMELQQFLHQPTDAHASIVLGLVSASVFLIILIYTIAIAAVCRLAVQSEESPDQPSRRIGFLECRLYAAMLRFLLVIGCFVAAIGFSYSLLKIVLPGSILEGAAALLFVMGLGTLFVRVGVLLPAIAVAESHGSVIRRAWRLSSGHFLPLFLVAVILLLPGVAVEFLGEIVGRGAHVFPNQAGGGTFEGHVILFRYIVSTFAILFSISVLLTFTLEAIASVAIYRVILKIQVKG